MASDNKKDPKLGKKLKFGKYTKTETKLVKVCREWGIQIPSWQPIGHLCIVWRKPPLTQSAGGLWIHDPSPISRGILVAWGPQAQDHLKSHGIELGDTVIFAQFAGDEHNDQAKDRPLPQAFLTIYDRDIQGSEDLRKGLESGKKKYVQVDGKTCLERPRALPAMDTKKAKLLRLAGNSGATPAERESAAKLAAKL